jgi:mitogen-activated protein kinase kinase kinase 17/18
LQNARGRSPLPPLGFRTCSTLPVEIDLPLPPIALSGRRINLSSTGTQTRHHNSHPLHCNSSQTDRTPTVAMTTKQLRRVRTLGRGASGAVVWLASDEASGELVAVKSARAAGAAAQLRREGRVLRGLSSPHIVPCVGARAAAGGEYQLLLEFAPGGSLADAAARGGGRLAERDIRAYAGDVARALAYLHGRSLVHGDVKARNVVVGGDGRARLTDFGCARPAAAGSARPFGGTPAFMAPEVARGEGQGPAADVWALGCTVVELATGRAPWGDADGLLAAVHRIGYTDDVPEAPAWMSADARDFLARCFERRAAARPTAAQLLAHPFVADLDARPKRQEEGLPSPKSTLQQDAFWDSDTDDEADEVSTGAAERIGALACAASALPDWDSDLQDGWIDLQHDRPGTAGAPQAATTEAGAAVADCFVWAELPDAEVEQLVATAADASSSGHGHLRLPHIAGVVAVAGATTTIEQGSYLPMHLGAHEKKTTPRPLDHGDDGIEMAGSHRACNMMNRAIPMKRISFKKKFPSGSLAQTVLHMMPKVLTCDHRTARIRVASRVRKGPARHVGRGGPIKMRARRTATSQRDVGHARPAPAHATMQVLRLRCSRLHCSACLEWTSLDVNAKIPNLGWEIRCVAQQPRLRRTRHALPFPGGRAEWWVGVCIYIN